MMKQTMRLNTLLPVVLAVGLFLGRVWRAFVPNVVLPDLDIPAMAAMVLIALMLEYFSAGAQKRSRGPQLLLGAVTFAVLPWAAELPYAGIRLTVCGTAVFGALTWMFDLAVQRMEVTTECKGTMVPVALIMYLACQCFMGMMI